jgi:hypothetical protein
MYKLTLILFALFSLVFPILAVPTPVPNPIGELAQRNTADAGTNFTGTVRAFRSQPSYDPDLSARRQSITILLLLLAPVLVVK